MAEIMATGPNGIISETEQTFTNFNCVFGIYIKFFSFGKKRSAS